MSRKYLIAAAVFACLTVVSIYAIEIANGISEALEVLL